MSPHQVVRFRAGLDGFRVDCIRQDNDLFWFQWLFLQQPLAGVITYRQNEVGFQQPQPRQAPVEVPGFNSMGNAPVGRSGQDF